MNVKWVDLNSFYTVYICQNNHTINKQVFFFFFNVSFLKAQIKLKGRREVT